MGSVDGSAGCRTDLAFHGNSTCQETRKQLTWTTCFTGAYFVGNQAIGNITASILLPALFMSGRHWVTVALLEPTSSCIGNAGTIAWLMIGFHQKIQSGIAIIA